MGSPETYIYIGYTSFCLNIINLQPNKSECQALQTSMNLAVLVPWVHGGEIPLNILLCYIIKF